MLSFCSFWWVQVRPKHPSLRSGLQDPHPYPLTPRSPQGMISTNNTGSHNHVFPGDDQLSNASGQGGWNSRTTGSWPYDADSTYPNASGGQIYRTNDDGGHSHNFNFNFNANTNNTGSHSHPVNGNSGNAGSHSHNVSVSVADGGESGTNKNLPPYYALCFIMKT